MLDKRDIRKTDSCIRLELKEDVNAGQLVELLEELNDAVKAVLTKHIIDPDKALLGCHFTEYRG